MGPLFPVNHVVLSNAGGGGNSNHTHNAVFRMAAADESAHVGDDLSTVPGAVVSRCSSMAGPLRASVPVALVPDSNDLDAVHGVCAASSCASIARDGGAVHCAQSLSESSPEKHVQDRPLSTTVVPGVDDCGHVTAPHETFCLGNLMESETMTALSTAYGKCVHLATNAFQVPRGNVGRDL